MTAVARTLADDASSASSDGSPTVRPLLVPVRRLRVFAFGVLALVALAAGALCTVVAPLVDRRENAVVGPPLPAPTPAAVAA